MTTTRLFPSFDRLFTQLAERGELTVEDAIELRRLLADYRTRGETLAATAAALEHGAAELRARSRRIDVLVERLLAAQPNAAGRERVLAEHEAWVALRPRVES